MAKKLTAKQEALLEAVFDGALQMLSENGEFDVDQALTATEYLRLRLQKVRPIDIMPDK